MNEKSTKQEESNEETRERLLRKFRDRKLVRSRKSAFSQTALEWEQQIYSTRLRYPKTFHIIMANVCLSSLLGAGILRRSGRKAIANMTTVLSASALYMAYIRDLNPSFRKRALPPLIEDGKTTKDSLYENRKLLIQMLHELNEKKSTK